MGWTSYHANNYKNGKVDRKAECDAYWQDSLNYGNYKVLKSTMVGSTYYAAVKALKKYSDERDENGNRLVVDIPENEQTVFAAVMLTSTNSKEYYNFSYKSMGETCGPCAYDCPESILKLLSPTDNEYAAKWREKCRKYNKSKKEFSSFSVGTKLKISLCGKEYEIIKRSPAHQFRSTWWEVVGENRYIKKNHIPLDYIVVR